jgi:O-acetyl-ADP-ribose deacetylase
VIHTVGPNWHRGQQDPADLASCFTRSMEVARAVGARSVAFPAVSSGIYGWGSDRVAPIAVAAVRAATTGHDDVDLVRFVLFSSEALADFERALARTYASRESRVLAE